MKIQNLRGSVILFFAFLSITLSQGAPAKERPIIEAFTENPCCEKVEKAGEISRKLAEEYNAIYITYDAAKETEKAEKYGANVGSVVVNRSVNINVFVVGVENMEEKIRQALGERPEKASPEGVKGETLVSKLRSFGRSFKLQRASLGLLLISSYLLGIFGGLNPCALGVFPMVVGYIAGKDVKVRRSFLIALVMGLGLTFVYMVFGLLVGFGISFTASSTAKLQRYSYGIGGV